jgi:carboxyl-terminal processing protease
MRKTNTILLIICIFLLLVLFGPRLSQNIRSIFYDSKEKENIEKFNEIVSYISTFYVDDVNWDDAMMGAIEGLLSELDPHSVYISSEDAMLNEENFQGKYQGIGIHFDVIDGYLTVIAPIPGSPSDKIGLLPGDKIIAINGESAINIASNDVYKKLKGPKGSSVEVTIKRVGEKEELIFTIVRDEIPISTINSSFMTPDSIAYISLGRFAKITDEEFEQALSDLSEQGMKKLILDLRWNAGGLLDQAVKLASKFLRGHEKIVYTEGRLSEFNEQFYTDSFNNEEVYDIPLIVLINHASASASEIVAGAIQDYDRGLIVGTTSFGKGLVQREYILNDNSRLRLTISKYYTPSGRLIQRPYKGKNIDQYYSTIYDSVFNTVDPDSMEKRPQFFTRSGRTVYGGGGITPDVEVNYISKDKRGSLTQKLSQKRLFFEVAAKYASQHAYMKNSFQSFLDDFQTNRNLLNELKSMALKKEIEFSNSQFEDNTEYFRMRIKAEIARSLWGTEKYYQVLLLHDNQYLEAMRLFYHMDQLLVPESIN